MLENVMVREWMTTPVISVPPSTPISTAHQLMKEHGIRRLPVVEAADVVGIITLGDVREASPSDATTLSIWEMNYLWAQLTVEKVMTRSVIHRQARRSAARRRCRSCWIRRSAVCPVVDDRGHLVGIITESDIFRMLVESRTKALAPKA